MFGFRTGRARPRPRQKTRKVCVGEFVSERFVSGFVSARLAVGAIRTNSVFGARSRRLTLPLTSIRIEALVTPMSPVLGVRIPNTSTRKVI